MIKPPNSLFVLNEQPIIAFFSTTGLRWKHPEKM
jgi:hypothetical protein